MISRTISVEELFWIEKNNSSDNSDRDNRYFSAKVSEVLSNYNYKDRKIADDLFYVINSPYFEEVDEDVFVHITKHVDDGKISLVPKEAEDGKKANLSAANSPDEADYLDNESFVLIHKDYIFFLGSGVSCRQVVKYLEELLLRFYKNDARLNSRKISDINILRKIQNSRVKQIRVDANIDNALYALNLSKANTSFFAGIKDFCKTVISSGTEDTLEEGKYAIGISITPKGAINYEEDLEISVLDDIALDIYHSSDALKGYRIEFYDKNEPSISLDRIILKEKVSLSRIATSIDIKQAKKALVQYRDKLIKSQTIV